MPALKKFNLKFQAKVLIPVVTVMVLFLAGTMWMVNTRIQTQLQTENQLALRNTESLFASSFQRHEQDLLHRYTAVTNQPDFFAIAQKFHRGEMATARDTMQEFLEGAQFKETSIALFADPAGQWHAGATPESFNSACAPLVRSVLETNTPATGIVQVMDSLFEVVVAPSSLPDNGPLLGALVVGLELGDATAKQWKTISDWKMPGLNGQQLFEHLLKEDPESANRMVFMTGDVLSDKTEKFLREHGKTCLAKPFSVADFQKVVNDLFK